MHNHYTECGYWDWKGMRMGIGQNESLWLKGLLRKYYAAHLVVPPYDVSKREFGFGNIKKIDSRHVGFESVQEMNQYLRNNLPLYFSGSISEYAFPSAQPMEKKQWLGSDLIYEFDADDLQTDCKQTHDSWKCTHCGAQGKGHLLKCTSCGKGVDLDEWTCDVCLHATKEKTKQLIKILQDDFQLNGLHVNFSGSKGFHVHVRQKEIFSLQKHARIELMDYLSLHELDWPSLGFVFDGKQFRCPHFAQAKGNAQRVMQEILRLVEVGTEEEWFILTGMPMRALKSFLENRQRMYNELQHGTLPAVPGKSTKTELFWNGILSSIAERLRLPIDRSTSGDIYKLLRVPDTVHGSTGFVAKSLSLETWEQFDPFSDAIAFSGEKERKIFVHQAPRIRIGSEILEPMQEKELVASAPVAVFLVGWGAAEIR